MKKAFQNDLSRSLEDTKSSFKAEMEQVKKEVKHGQDDATERIMKKACRGRSLINLARKVTINLRK